MPDINFAQIAPRCNGPREAFEELSCQIARNTVPPGAPFVRLRGSGGDGGVECYADLADGTRTGWQAKFVFDIDTLLTQLTDSLATALAIHPSLTRYVVCFPFDSTGPTGRKDQSNIEKFAKWRKKQEESARKAGRQLAIEDWPASRLRDLLLKLDVSGGVRLFFFNEIVLSASWFEQHLSQAAMTAGPRYTPELSVETPLWKWFSALGHGADWSSVFSGLLRECDTKLERLTSAVKHTADDPMDPAWPDTLRGDGDACVKDLTNIRSICSSLLAAPTGEIATQCINALSQYLGNLSVLEAKVAEGLRTRHGEGFDSPNFWQFMAEYQVSFPTANLDTVRECLEVFGKLHDWLKSPAGWLAFESTFLLLGAAGTGKTHGVCDAAMRRFASGQLSVITFGHLFRGEPEPWTRLRDSLGLPGNVGRESLLDALNSAAEASGSLMIIWLDAINETKPLRYWREHLFAFAEAVRRRPFLRLCVTCRTSFVPYCVPEGDKLYRAEHQGFAGVEREACRSFFTYYGLEPPVVPILQPELANPLYLRLVCETLKSRGLKRLPAGWAGLATAIRAFLEEKDRRFALEMELSLKAEIVSGSLYAIASEIARTGDSTLIRSAADRAVRQRIAIPESVQILDWLVREDLLIEDSPRRGVAVDAEGGLRPAFERLGDFLIAHEALAGLEDGKFKAACEPGGPLAPFLGSEDAVGTNEGIVSAISILVPEEFAKGTELPDFFDDGPLRLAILKTTVSSYPWRDPSSFGSASSALLHQALRIRGFAAQAFDALLEISWQPSAIDAFWLNALLRKRPLAMRDAYWCGYLHQSYEGLGPVRRLIENAFDIPLDQIERSVAERWAILLLWFTAAADRRVKDNASRAATAILQRHKQVLADVLRVMLFVDDDAVRERTLLTAYGTGLLAGEQATVAAICDVLAQALTTDVPNFHNAVLRDHVRSIAELGRKLGEHGRAGQIEVLLDKLKSSWPLELPTDDLVTFWDESREDLPKLAQSCLHDDFFVYSMRCLDEWQETVPKAAMARWILRHIVEDLGYLGSGCEEYDSYMLGLHGGGRSRPNWAERIGKKYQWIAMYRLAARLSDHVDRKRPGWEPKPLRKPLILIEERQFDPTLPRNIVINDEDERAWWMPATVDLHASAMLSHAAWVKKCDDVPALSQLLAPFQNGGDQWRLLNGYFSWRQRDDEGHRNTPYRRVWVHLEGYLVSSPECDKAFTQLRNRNFFGRWMPEGATWLYGFAAEYPWGAAYNTEPEEYHGRGGSSNVLPCAFVPVRSQLAAEWEYDASLSRNLHINLPARVLFEPGDLWWDGHDGFRRSGSRTIIRDPSVTEPGPSALIVTDDDLMQRLRRIKKRLIWTLLGEKLVIGLPDRTETPRRTFSQIASLGENGSVRFSEMAFFDDYDEATGPLGTTKSRLGSPTRTAAEKKKQRRRGNPSSGRPRKSENLREMGMDSKSQIKRHRETNARKKQRKGKRKRK